MRGNKSLLRQGKINNKTRVRQSLGGQPKETVRGEGTAGSSAWPQGEVVGGYGRAGLVARGWNGPGTAAETSQESPGVDYPAMGRDDTTWGELYSIWERRTLCGKDEPTWGELTREAEWWGTGAEVRDRTTTDAGRPGGDLGVQHRSKYWCQGRREKARL